MEITFDFTKDAINVRKHGISLSRVKDFDFDAALYSSDDSEDYGENRLIALGFIEARLYFLIFAQRGESIRAISLRKADKHEEKEYRDNY